MQNSEPIVFILIHTVQHILHSVHVCTKINNAIRCFIYSRKFQISTFISWSWHYWIFSSHNSGSPFDPNILTYDF
jgi:hypothetical protein